MSQKICLDGLYQLPKCDFALRSALGPAMSRRTKNHVLVAPSQLPGRTMTVITSSDDLSMYFSDQFLIDGTIIGKFCDPSICPYGSPCLPL